MFMRLVESALVGRIAVEQPVAVAYEHAQAGQLAFVDEDLSPVFEGADVSVVVLIEPGVLVDGDLHVVVEVAAG